VIQGDFYLVRLHGREAAWLDAYSGQWTTSLFQASVMTQTEATGHVLELQKRDVRAYTELQYVAIQRMRSAMVPESDSA